MEDVLELTETKRALESLLAMARDCASSNVSTIRTLVLKVLSHPLMFCGFDQIKAALGPAVASGDGQVLGRTLDLFSYGSIHDYTSAAPSTYLPLTDGQLNKLRQLTVVSLVQKACSSSTAAVSYDDIAQELGFAASTTDGTARNRQVEEVVICCIYARIVSGQLCQKSKSLVLSQEGPPCRARDVPPSQVADMLAVVQSLTQNIQTTSATLHSAKGKAKKAREQNVEYWSKVEERALKVKEVSGAMGGPTTRAAVSFAAESSGSSNRRDFGGRPTTSRQTKRSRGGLSGALGDTFGRY